MGVEAAKEHGAGERRTFAFDPTPAVSAARAHKRFVPCPTCQADSPRYLFHRTGVRFVQCAACATVYVNPAREKPVNYLDIEGIRPFTNERDRHLTLADFEKLLERVSADHLRIAGKPLERTLLVGQFLREFRDLPIARRIGLEIAEIGADEFERLATRSDVAWADSLLAEQPQVLLLHELLEACSDPGAVMQRLAAAAPSALFVVTYTNADSLPARMMRRYWPPFFEHKTAFFGTGNLTALMARFGPGPQGAVSAAGHAHDAVRERAARAEGGAPAPGDVHAPR